MRLRKRSVNTGRRRQLAQPGGETGASNEADTYQDRRSSAQLQRDNLKAATARTGHYWLQRLGFLVLLIAAMASAVNVLSLNTNAKVLPLTGDKGKLLQDSSLYEAAAQKALAASVWNRNKITVDTGSVTKKLKSQFPELAGVSVTVPLLAHRPVVYIQPATPALILVNGGGAYLIDTSGRALIKANDPAGLNQPSLPTVADESGLPLSLNKPALTGANINFIAIVAAQLAAKQLPVVGMSLPASANELDVQLADRPFIVKFNLQTNDAREQAGTLIATLKQLQQQNITPAKYIDVRLSGRAYYQ